MKNGAIVVLDRIQKVAEGMRELAENRVLVGIPASKTERTDENDTTPLNNAEIGYIQERGAPEANIPARPHLVPGVKKSQGEWLPRLGDATKAAIDGRPGGVTGNLSAAGMIAKSAVQEFITRGEDFAPLAPSTIAKRMSQGFKGIKPLIRSGQYRRAITYVLRRGK